eukprot:scaffold10794_cov66-Phaeocystis_antarctica.AAC.7
MLARCCCSKWRSPLATTSRARPSSSAVTPFRLEWWASSRASPSATSRARPVASSPSASSTAGTSGGALCPSRA